MKRVLVTTVAAIAAFAGCARALAQVSASATASVTVEQAAGINVVSPLVLPTVSTTAIVPPTVATSGVPANSVPGGSTVGNTASGGAGSSTSATAGTSGGAPAVSNATLTIYGQSGDAVSMAVPETFKVIRTGGTETLTVKTNTNSEYSLGGNGVVLGGGLNADTMSVNVGGSLALASAGPLVPGPYEGMLVVVVQYN
jgi:hypothetical protein